MRLFFIWRFILRFVLVFPPFFIPVYLRGPLLTTPAGTTNGWTSAPRLLCCSHQPVQEPGKSMGHTGLSWDGMGYPLFAVQPGHLGHLKVSPFPTQATLAQAREGRGAAACPGTSQQMTERKARIAVDQVRISAHGEVDGDLSFCAPSGAGGGEGSV